MRKAAGPAAIERARLFGVTPDKLIGLARDTDALREQSAGLAGTCQISVLARLERNLRQPVGAAALTAPAVSGGPTPAPAPSSVEHRCLEAVADITRSVIEQRDINDILCMVLESLVRVVAFDVAFLALVTVQRDRIVGRMSCDPATEDAVARLTVPLTRGAGVLADVVLERRSQMVVDGSARCSRRAAGAPAGAVVRGRSAHRPRPVRRGGSRDKGERAPRDRGRAVHGRAAREPGRGRLPSRRPLTWY
jgi:hypothetical protein